MSLTGGSLKNGMCKVGVRKVERVESSVAEVDDGCARGAVRWVIFF